MMQIGQSALTKLGIESRPGRAYRELQAGKSTQVPVVAILDVGSTRTKRKLKIGAQEVFFERT
jgi:hypothetical protein